MRPFNCYWEVDGPSHYWPVDAECALVAARVFAMEYDLSEDPEDLAGICVVTPQELGGYGPAGPSKRFRAYRAAGSLCVELVVPKGADDHHE